MENPLTDEIAITQPSKLESTVLIMYSAGFLKSINSFSCHYSKGYEDEPREHVLINLVIPSSIIFNIDFAFYSDGEIKLGACPNCRNDYQSQYILTATYPNPSDTIELIIENSKNVIEKTIAIYATTNTVNVNEALMQAWEPLQPKLYDRFEENPTGNSQVESSFSLKEKLRRFLDIF